MITDMNAKILERLSLIETTHGVEILFAVEAGSRVWGFAGEDSDYDVRFVYKRPLNHYLSILDRRDVIEAPSSDGIDLQGWDMKKALYQFGRGNPQFNEWLASPIRYRDSDFTPKLIALKGAYFNSRVALLHYFHLAANNQRSYLQGEVVQYKKYLHVVRALLCCLVVDKTKTNPPIHLDDLLREVGDNQLVGLVRDLIKMKIAGDLSGPPISFLDHWINALLDLFSAITRGKFKKVTSSHDDLNDLMFWELVGWGDFGLSRIGERCDIVH